VQVSCIISEDVMYLLKVASHDYLNNFGRIRCLPGGLGLFRKSMGVDVEVEILELVPANVECGPCRRHRPRS
jgi:hypothetical protein